MEGDAPVVAETVVAAPAPRLASLVRNYIGYRYEGFAPGKHLGLPSHDLTVVISLGAPLRLAATPDPAQPAAEFTACAAGLHTRAATIVHDGDQYGVQLELTPAGARSLLGLPAGALGPGVVELGELLGSRAHEIAERMAAAPSWHERFGVLDDVLSRRTDRAAACASYLTRAWQSIVGSGGTARIGDLAADLGWSRRHLGARFAREYGLTPKEAARVVRFETSKRMLQRPGPPALAEVAAACGYYDQAHLARDWNDLAGCPPSVWLATEELPFVQDGGGEQAAGWTA